MSNNNVLRSKYELSEPEFKYLSDYVLNSLLINREKVLIIDSLNEKSWTGQEIHDICFKIANLFTNDYQLRSGDVLCINCSNALIKGLLFISSLICGVISVFISQKSTFDSIVKIFHKTNFKILICGQESEKVCETFSDNYSKINVKLFTYGDVDYKSRLNCLNVKNLLKSEKNEIDFKQIDRNSSDVILIELTSGTIDGNCKAVFKTHRNLIYSILQLNHEEILANNANDVIISIPFHKLFGVSLFLNSLISGSKLVLNEGNLESDGNKFMETIEKFNVTKLILFSADIKYMISREVNLVYDVSSIKEIVHIGIFDEYNDLRLRIESMFKCRYFRPIYGCVETGIISCIHKSKSFERNCYSVGELIPGIQLKIVDIRSGESLPGYKIGEICVKSNQNTSGYLTSPFEEKKLKTFTTDGFFRTGDTGYYDTNGYLYLESKLSDIVVIDDEVLQPNELQILLMTHPSVVDATVLGIFCDEEYEDSDESNNKSVDKRNIELLSNTFKAFVVLRPGSDINELDLINFINDRVEPIKQLDSGIYILDILPRNSMGIINKSLLIRNKN